jgi:gliding motility-associated-like protein
MKNLLVNLKRIHAFALFAFVMSLTFVSSAQFAIVGTGPTSNTTTSYPAPYGNYWWGARHQFLVTAAELTAAGIPAGATISSLGFNVTGDNGATNHVGFQVIVYSTVLADPLATGYVTTGQVSSSTAVNYNPFLGWNQHNLTPFVWNGTSNLVIQSCFNNTNFTTNAQTQWTTTLAGASIKSRYRRADATGVCGNTLTTATSTTTRPNIRFAWAASTACTGTPNAGSASITSASGCAGSSFTLNASGVTSGSGITYQWQSAPSATGPWTNIGGATATSLTTSASANTFYQLVTTCTNSGLSNTSSVVSYTVNSCLGSITMTDSYGDGWNGATMTLNVNGSPFQTFGSTFTTGVSQTINFCLPANSTYSLFYNGAGLYPTEVGVSLTINGTNVYSVGAGGATIGATLNSGVACPPACTGTPNTPTASVANSSVCVGESTTLSSTGFSAGSGITYQWQSGPSATGPWTNIGGATATSYLVTGAAGTTFYRLVTTCVNSTLTSASNAVSINGVTCFNVPFSGNTTVNQCSGILYDHGGSIGGYANFANGYTVITSSTPGSAIQISGNLNSESGFDFLTVYDGVGLGGTILWTGSGITAVPTLTSSGGSLTVRFTSDGSITASGFQLTWICVPPAPTVTGTATTICSNQGTTVDLTASGAVGTVYWFQGGCNTTGQLATGTTLTVSPTTTTTYYARNFSGGQWSACATYTVTVNPTPSGVNAGADVAVQCPGTSVPLTGAPAPVPGSLSVVISAPPLGYLDEVSWTLTNSAATVIGSGGSYSAATTGDTYTIPIGSSANGPYSFFIESQGFFNDNVVNYTIICNGSAILTGSLNGGQTTTQSVSSCGSNFTYTWTPAATVASPTSATTAATPLSTTTYTLTVTENGCSASDQMTITVLDNTNPTITAPANINTVADAGTCNASGVVIGTPVTSDNCLVASVTNDAPSFFPVGTTIVTWTVTDGFGNTATATQTVIVVDNQNPTITAPAAVSANADFGLCTASAVSLGNPAIADNCSVVSIVNNAPAAFPVGNTTVTWTISDASGNTSSATQVVTVIDNQIPTITAPANVTAAADPGLCSATGVALGTPIVADNCGIASVSSNAPAVFPDGPTTVTWTVTDVSGNTVSATQTVTVVDNQAPQVLCQNVFVNLDATGSATVTASQIDNGSTDNCSIASLALSQTSFGCANVGVSTVTLTVTDNTGNSSTCSAFVIVSDITAPAAVCQNVTLNLDPVTGSGSITAAQVNNGSSDNCSVANLALSQTAFTCSNVGVNPVTLTVTDNSGNSSTCAALVTVQDVTAPVALCQNVTLNLDPVTGTGSVTAAQVNNGSSDNCSIASIVLSQTAFTCSNVGVNPVTLTLTDNSGNSSTCPALVIVSELTAPIALCQNVTLNLDPVTGAGTITPVQVNNNSTDACGIASLSLSQTNFSCANLGANTVTLTVVDVNGNSSTCTSTITVIDNTAPSFNTTPSSISQNSVLGNCGRVITYAAPTFFDACSSTMAQTDGSGLTSGDFFPVGVTNQTYTITDPSGNTTSYTFTVTIVDNQLPVITNCPANMTLAASPTSCNALANWIAPSGSDNCPGVVVSSTHAPGSSFPVGTTTVTYTATDASNNQATCSFTVTVLDNTGPFVASLPTVTGQCNAVVTAPVVVDNCTGSVTGTTSDPLVYSNQGTYFVNWTFTDANGNTSTAVQVVIVQDNTDPIITAPAPLTVSANASCTATGLTLGTPTTSDNCSAVTVTNNAPAVYPIGTTIVTWTATDAVGNTSTASQIITVLDNTIPTITAPANITLNATASCNVTGVSLGNPVTSDNCGVSSVVNNAPASFPVGTTQVTWTVIDNAGNSTSAIQTVTVIDVTNPTITAPAAVTLNANASCVAFNANLGSPVTADNCTVALITNNAPSVFPLGNTTVTWTVTDASGNTATATQVVTVIDVVNPTIIAPATVTVGTNNACTSTGVNLGTATASDNCSAVTITNNAPTTFPLGSTTVTWTATDAAGNSTTASQIVIVVDQTNPTIVAPADINASASASCTITNVTLGNPSVGDNCGVASVTNNAPTSFPIGTTLITWTVTDNAGNTATSIQTVSVVDNTNPTIIAPAAVTANANSSCVAFNVNLGSPVTADNCSVASVSNNAPSVFPIGTTTVIWTVTDAAGNTSTANQVVTVIDVINPAITAPTAVTVVANNGCTATGVVLGNAIASDNCSSVTITNNAPASFQLGNTTVVWTATDAAGNISTANQVVTVVDQTNPTITAPVNITVNAGNSCNISGIVLGFPVVADNCGVANVANDAPSTFPIGTTLVTWTIIDNAGNTATSTQTVTVVDNTNPIITAPANVTVDANSSCVAFNVNLGSPITSDNCAVVSITNDAPSVFELGSTTVTWTVTDGSGNSAAVTQSVTVIDNIDPEIIAPANLQVIANADCSATGVVLGNPIATDNCSGVTVQNNAPAVFPVGSTVVIWTATDASGNSSTAQQTVTVTDDVNPTVLVQDLTVTLDDNGDAQISFNDIDAGTFDNCGIASTVLSQSDFSCADIGVINVSVTVVDNSGNVSVGTASITVQSNGVDSDFDGIDDSCDDQDNEVVEDVPEAFTPNGNNINDFFEIKNITTFNERKLEIFNRYGMSVYANDQYDNTWDGTRKDNGQALPDGTYYYVLTLDGEIKKGFIYINRVKQ